MKEGINLPRYPSLPGRLRARRAAVERTSPDWADDGLRVERLRVPGGERRRDAVLGNGRDAVLGNGRDAVLGNGRDAVLGNGRDAVPALVALLEELGVLR